MSQTKHGSPLPSDSPPPATAIANLGDPSTIDFSQFDLYQQLALATAVYPHDAPNDGLNYCVVSLFGELGEFANLYKKCLRGDFGPDWRLNTDLIRRLHKELQGALWYFAATAHELHIPLSTIASANITDLAGRASRGTIRGSGDNR